MSVNRYLPHVFVLPEDDANTQIANGFLLELSTRQIYVLPEAGGWPRVRDGFVANQIAGMQMYPGRFMILLVDFDQDANRLATMRAVVPPHLNDRVFVLGAWSDPEALKRSGLGSYETIGKAMAEDCHAGTDAIWGHELLQHNACELERLREQMCHILFPSL